MKNAEQTAEQYTNKLITQINEGRIDGRRINVRNGDWEEELDEDDAFAQFLIQPKGDDSVDSLAIITRHNKQILSTLRDKGFDITRFVVPVEEENVFEMHYAM